MYSYTQFNLLQLSLIMIVESGRAENVDSRDPAVITNCSKMFDVVNYRSWSQNRGVRG
jgi:hypothetical protein